VTVSSDFNFQLDLSSFITKKVTYYDVASQKMFQSTHELTPVRRWHAMRVDTNHPGIWHRGD
jgi:hypothetical protein